MSTDEIRPWAPSPELRRHIQELAFRQTMSEEARAYIEAALTAGPSRRVQARRGNVITEFFSRKMNTSHRLESRTGEFPMAVQFEADPDVLAYVAQPPQVSLTLLNEEGQATTTRPYTPDFLVVRRDGVEVVETRDDGELARRALDNGHQFFKDDQGRWHYRAADGHFSALGFVYRLIANSQHPALLVENERFLEDYISEGCPPLPEAKAESIRRYVTEARFAPLVQMLENGFAADDIYKAIVARQVFVDLKVTRLAATNEVIVFADESTQRAHALICSPDMEPNPPIAGSMHIKEGSRIRTESGVLTVCKLFGDQVLVQNDTGQEKLLAVSVIWGAVNNKVAGADEIRNGTDARQLADCSAIELERAMDRLKALREGDTSQWSQRSLSRFAGEVAGAANELDAVIRLVDKSSQRGNREPKLLPVNLELIEQAVRKYYNNPTQMRKKGAYFRYVESCEGKHEASGQPVRPTTYSTFCRYCERLKDVHQRHGKRVAYQQKPIAQAVSQNLYPVHGVRPHEICYVDHTIANIATIAPNGTQLGKPTLTLAVDGHTTQVRALVLSYDKPSIRTVLMVIRDYVRRHHRLPRVLVVDNGAEFRSRELQDLCRLLGMDLRFRPPGMPRGGAMIERLLGATEDEVFSELAGNTRMLKKDARLVTKSVDPFRRAEWTLPAVYGAVENYLFQAREHRIHPALGMTPSEFEKKRLEETGVREHRMYILNEDMMLLTSPHADRRFHKVDRQRGIWVGGLWYRHPALWETRHDEKVEVRVEPWNARIVYVRVNNRWVAAVGTSSRWIGTKTTRELEVAMRHEAKESATRANKDALEEKTNGRTEKGPLQPHHFDERLRIQVAEMRHLYEPLGMTSAMQVDVPSDAPQDLPDQPSPPVVPSAEPARTQSVAKESNGHAGTSGDSASTSEYAIGLRQIGFR